MTLAVLAASAAGTVAAAPSAQAANWVEVGSSCTSGGVANWSIVNRCWAKKKLGSDGSSTNDYFTLRMTASGNATNGKYMSKLWVEPYRSSGTATQAWTGADPWSPNKTVTTTGSCRDDTWTIGLGVQGASVAYSTTTHVCKSESFGPKLYSDAGHHAGIWSAPTGSRVSSGVVRYTAALVSVRTAQNATAQWSVDRWGANTHYSQTS